MFSFDFSMLTIDDIIEYFTVIAKKILAFFKIEVNEEALDNLGSMRDELEGYQPEI